MLPVIRQEQRERGQAAQDVCDRRRDGDACERREQAEHKHHRDVEDALPQEREKQRLLRPLDGLEEGDERVRARGERASDGQDPKY